MPHTDDELDALESIAFTLEAATDIEAPLQAESLECFQRIVLPRLAAHSAGELLALSGMLAHRAMPHFARFIAAYAYATEQAVRDGSPRPDPRLFLRKWDAEEAASAELADELPF